jgi:predicted dehydrogenase
MRSRILVALILCGAVSAWRPLEQPPAARPAWATKDLRAGIIGTDTSHAPAFTAAFLAHPEWRIRVVAAFKGGSPDLPLSATRVEGFAATIHDKNGVEIVDTIDALLTKVDVVLLLSVDGRVHLSQATPVLRAGKPVFIDKPLAASVDDGRRIAALSRQTGAPFFSSSSTRFHADIPRLRTDAGIGKVASVQGTYTLNRLEHHPDLYYYGIHGVEALYAVMGTGCVSVSRRTDGDVDVTTGKWSDGRAGVFRGLLKPGDKSAMLKVKGDKGTAESSGPQGYDGLLVAMAEFFQTGRSPVPVEQTIEILEFMTAADLSRDRRGAEVPLAELRK